MINQMDIIHSRIKRLDIDQLPAVIHTIFNGSAYTIIQLVVQSSITDNINPNGLMSRIGIDIPGSVYS